MIATLGCYLWPFLISLLFSSTPNRSDKPSATPESSVVAAASMNTPRSGQTATLLPTGHVLITGGMNGNGTYFETTETYDPSANRFVEAMSMSARRIGHTATLLASGKVLIAGGFDGGYLQTAELYDPLTRRFSPTGRLTIPAGAAEDSRPQPLAAVVDHAEKVSAIDVVGVKILPYRHQLPDTAAEIARAGREHSGIDSAG